MDKLKKGPFAVNHLIWNRLTAIGLVLLCIGVAGCDGFNETGAEPTTQAEARKLTPGTRFQDQLEDGGQGPEMVVIPAGRFMMGEAPNDFVLRESVPAHQVTIDQPFALSTHEITNAQYVRFLNAKGHRGPGLQSPENYEWVKDQVWGLHSKLIEKEVPGCWG